VTGEPDYMLIGLTWAGMYEIIHGVWPGAFRFSEPVPERRIDLATSLAYFSFVTLTTMGYGDITPLHPVARSAAILEALVGQLFPAILIARLVSMELAARERRF
jgi:ion channel